MGKGYLHTGYWEPGGWGRWRMGGGVGGGQKADHQGFREQRPDTWSWGVGGARKGKPEEQLGIQTSEMRGFGEPGERQG